MSAVFRHCATIMLTPIRVGFMWHDLSVSDTDQCYQLAVSDGPQVPFFFK